MFTVTKDKALLTTTTGALPRPSWYTANLRGMPLSHGFSQHAYREQHFDCLACHVAAQHRAGIDILVDGDTRLDDDVAGRSWVSYATERIAGIGAPRVEVPPAGFMADKGPGDLMWEVIETRMTPPVTGKIGETSLQLDRAYKAIAPMTDRPVKIGSISAQILALMLTDEHYKDRLHLLMDLSAALNREYHALADAGAPLVQIEEPAIHQIIPDPNQTSGPSNGSRRSTRGQRPARQVRGVVPHLLGQPGGAARGQPRSVVQGGAALFRSARRRRHYRRRRVQQWHGPRALRHDDLKNKKIALGVISHRTLQVERPEEIADLIRRALKHIEPERLILTSDCGFGRQSMSRMHAVYKMVALVRGANIVRKELGLPEAYIPGADAKLSMVPLAKG